MYGAAHQRQSPTGSVLLRTCSRHKVFPETAECSLALRVLGIADDNRLGGQAVALLQARQNDNLRVAD